MKEQQVVDLITQGNFFDIPLDAFANRHMTQNELVSLFRKLKAFWQYTGEPCAEKPHALLKSGKHSNGFIPCKDVLKYPFLCKLLALEMCKKLTEDEISQIDVVASSAYSAITIGYEVATLLGKHVEHVIVEKDSNGNPTIIRGGIDASKTVLIVNELMTTGNGSTWETKKAVLECNGKDLPPKIFQKSLVLIHRSQDYKLHDGSEVIPVFHFDIADFTPDDCPYCKAGSSAIKPKLGNNWKLLCDEV